MRHAVGPFSFCVRGLRVPKSCSGAVIAALLATAPLAAQGPRPNLHDKLQFNASLATIILNTNIRVDGSSGTGTDIDAEDDLGLAKDRLAPRFAVRWRPWRRHEFEVGYQFARRSSGRVLDRDITFGDSTYNVGATVDSKLNTDEAFLVYRFAFLAKPRTQVGLAMGLGAVFLDAGIGAVGGGGAQYSQSESVTGPLGSLGLYGRFLSGDRWWWEAEARYVQVSIDRFTARVVGGGGAVRYAAWSKLLLECGYGLTGVQVDIAAAASSGSGSRSGRIKYTLQNVRLGAVFVP